MTENNKTAILLGASGLVGGFLLDMLLDCGTYNHVLIIVRKPLGKEHPILTEYVIDFDDPQSYKDLVKGDDLFCCLGTTIKKAGSQAAFRKVDYEYPITFAEIAKENGIKQYLIITAIGANAQSSVFYTRTKGECENSIKALGLPSVKIFRPSLLTGNRKEFRLGEKLSTYVMKAFSFFMTGKWKKYRPVECRQVAKAMLCSANQESAGVSIFESDQIQAF